MQCSTHCKHTCFRRRRGTRQRADSLWAKQSGPIDARQLLDKAIDNRVAYVPGSEFHHDAHDSSNLRLSFRAPIPQFMDEAIHRLADTIATVLKNTKSD
jgi:DNA-binding transcriptional MocR family regulator